MQELVQVHKSQASLHKSISCSKDVMIESLSVMLPVLSTLNEKACKPFWNPQCQDVESMLWLPQKTDSQVQGLNLSDGLLNYMKDLSQSWMTRVIPLKPLTHKNLSVSLPRSVITIMEIDPLKGAKVVASKKIRFYPDNEKAYKDVLGLYRRSYNLAVERFRNNDYKDENGKFINMRPDIKAQVKQEQEAGGRAYNSIVSDSGTLAATTTFKAVCSRNKKLKGAKSGFSEISFKSRKGSKQSFSIDRLPKGLHPCERALGKIHLTETVPEEAINKTAIITLDRGRWFIQVQQHIKLQSEIQGDVKCVGIDQGVRTFATCFSEKEALIVGDNFAKDKLAPLMLKVDKLLSEKRKLMNHYEGLKLEVTPQWYTDRLAHFDKEINRLKCKKDDLILDLHNRLAYELVSSYDVIFLPKFETKQMVKRKDKKVRTIRRNTVRQMLDLNHYSFKLRLKWYAKKYGKVIVDCNEAYTSKTRSWDGSIDDKLGSSKVIRGDGFSVDRDINGARNILLKHLTRV
ncbi:transposase [Vibrio phage F88]